MTWMDENDARLLVTLAPKTTILTVMQATFKSVLCLSARI